MFIELLYSWVNVLRVKILLSHSTHICFINYSFNCVFIVLIYLSNTYKILNNYSNDSYSIIYYSILDINYYFTRCSVCYFVWIHYFTLKKIFYSFFFSFRSSLLAQMSGQYVQMCTYRRKHVYECVRVSLPTKHNRGWHQGGNIWRVWNTLNVAIIVSINI